MTNLIKILSKSILVGKINECTDITKLMPMASPALRFTPYSHHRHLICTNTYYHVSEDQLLKDHMHMLKNVAYCLFWRTTANFNLYSTLSSLQ